MKYHIGFSHHYPKLHEQTKAKLLAVIPLDGKDINPELMEYDTSFAEPDGTVGHFPLKKSGNYIQLVFIGDKRIPFCTIRSAYPPSKVEYYTNATGQWFDINYKSE